MIKIRYSIKHIIYLTLGVAIGCSLVKHTVKKTEVINYNNNSYIYGIFITLRNNDMIALELENISLQKPGFYLAYWNRPNTAPHCIGITKYSPFIQNGTTKKVYYLFPRFI